MSDPQRQLDHAAIERLVYDYAAGIDRRDYPLLRACLDEQLVISFRPAGEVGFVGTGPEPLTLTAEQFVDRNRSLFVGFAGTHHQITNLRIDVDGDRATEAAYLQATHFVPGEPRFEYTFGAFYANELRRTDEGWRFTKIDLSVVWERGDSGMTERARRTVMG